MEMILQQQDWLHYAEVYASDIIELKNFFLQKFGVSRLNENFGIPFLSAKKRDKIVAFASLVTNQFHQIDFVIYENSDLKEIENEDFKMKSKDYCKRKDSENFRDPVQLQYNIERMIDWLNDAV
ncbi:hypothetical protein PFY12_09230 [Chryseobacterium camelliae]|uniref:Uncharacterized protein n=1 Tax=Chryseobacterium camelliae TaxID=1265445 RepID=A0ABY7QKP9_9FLAO|nr:hypothetical protein [Chryseobacterium camelliae]WBV59243.1 hypothetical protein PFY12_09230 [Chryseobacterium camelliae]